MEYLIVGLGNPGEEYEDTRHNVGFEALDVLAKESEWQFSERAQASYTHVQIDEYEVELLKPKTFMNRSGRSVQYRVVKHELTSEQVIVIHDEVDLPLGVLQIAYDRGPAGHNGVKSVIESLGTKAFTRIRIGVTPTNRKGDLEKPRTEEGIHEFVLGEFTKNERKAVDGVLKQIPDVITTLLAEGRERAMNMYN